MLLLELREHLEVVASVESVGPAVGESLLVFGWSNEQGQLQLLLLVLIFSHAKHLFSE